MTETHSNGVDRRSWLERALSAVAEVRPGEGLVALLLAACTFLLLLAYYLIKPVRDALILPHPAGAEYKSWLQGAVAIALLVAVPAYSRLVDRLERHRLVIGVTLFFASHLVLFYLATLSPALRESLALAIVFFVWLGVFNMMLVAQLFGYANDLFSEPQGRRLLPIVGVGASVGAVAGSTLRELMEGTLGLFPMLLVSALALGCVSVMAFVVHRQPLPSEASEGALPAEQGASSAERRGGGAGSKGASSRDGFSIVWATPYLRLLAAFALVFTTVNTNGEYVLGKLIKEAAETAVAAGELQPDEVGGYIGGEFGALYTWVNWLGLGLQLLVVSRVVRYAGLRVALFVLPIIALADSTALLLWPIVAVVFVGKVAENATDYSLNNTLRQMMWLPTTAEMKYKAKQAVDTFFVRMGDMLSGLLVFIAVTVLGQGVRTFVLFNVVLVAMWLLLSWRIGRRYEELRDARSEG